METPVETDEFCREVTSAMAGGDEEAYRRFYDTCFDRLYRHLLLKTRGDEALARELGQIVLLRVVRYIKPFGNARVLWAWLYQLCRSVHVDWLRRNSQESARIELWKVESPEPSEADEELLAVLDQSIGSLDANEQELLKLAYFDALSQNEIARRTQTTPKAVESKLARTRNKLRQLLLNKLKEYALF